MPRRNWSRLTILSILALQLSCNKQVLVDYIQLPSQNVTLTLNPGQPGLAAAPAFVGLSFETSVLTKRYLTSADDTLLKLFKLIYPGVLRIGGTSVDNIFWTGTTRKNSKATDSLYTDDLDNLFAFARAAGWKVILSLNLAQAPISKAVSEAEYAYNSAGGALYAFELGSDPDLYVAENLKPSTYDDAAFQTQWYQYYTSVRLAVPSVPFVGPGTESTSWLQSFISADYSHIGECTLHYYRLKLSANDLDAGSLLSPPGDLGNDVTEAVASCRTDGIGFRMEECNSVDDGGKDGLSNTFASALWGLDLMLSMAQTGVTGVNFGGDMSSPSTPILEANQTYTAQPLFYAMVCFQYGSAGNFIPLTLDNPGSINVSAYAVIQQNGRIVVTFINKESGANASNANVFLHSGATMTSASYVALSAPALTTKAGTSASDITLGGNYIRSGGSLPLPTITPIKSVEDDTLAITVPAGTAMVITLNP